MLAAALEAVGLHDTAPAGLPDGCDAERRLTADHWRDQPLSEEHWMTQPLQGCAGLQSLAPEHEMVALQTVSMTAPTQSCLSPEAARRVHRSAERPPQPVAEDNDSRPPPPGIREPKSSVATCSYSHPSLPCQHRALPTPPPSMWKTSAGATSVRLAPSA